MSYKETELTRLKRQSSKQAIALAMQGKWREAVVANKSIIDSFPGDTDAYNRLGRAHMELGEYSLARESYERAIKLDPYNNIARKNLERLTYLGEAVVSDEGASHKVEPQQFIGEVGKAGVVNLYRLAPPGILAKTVAGSRVSLRIDGSDLIVENSSGEYLGQVGPKHRQRLVKLIEGGNKYVAAVISATEEAVKVIIREIYRHPSQAGRLSFPPRGAENLRPYVGDRIIRRELDYEEALSGTSTYTVIGGEEPEILTEEPADIDDDNEE